MYGLCSVAFLGVELATIPAYVHRLNRHQVSLHVMAVVSRCVVGCRHYCLTGWVEAKVCLVQLLVKGRVDCCVVVDVGVVDSLSIELVIAILEELVKDGLLLVIVDVHTLSLDGTTLNSNRVKASYY